MRWIAALSLWLGLFTGWPITAHANVECSMLDPRASVSQGYQAKIQASVDTLYKIAKAGGSLEGQFTSEINNLQKGVPVSDQGLVQLRTMYLFCAMFANSAEIPADRKVELFQQMMNMKASVASGAGPSISAATPDFPSGSKRVYSANFSGWLNVIKNDDGMARVEGSQYVLYPASNTWFGPPRATLNNAVDGDFVLDMVFRLAQRGDYVSVQLDIQGRGPDQNYVNTILSFPSGNPASYSIDKGWIKGNNLVREQMVASSKPLPNYVQRPAANQSIKLTVKRANGEAQVFVDDTFIERFNVSRFPLLSLRIAAAGASKVQFSQIEVRVP